jgi:uncharacterized protein
MSLIQRIADRLIIQPTKHYIDAEHRTRVAVACDDNELEIWTQRIGDRDHPDVVVLKFIGAGGRAEYSGPHPVETWNVTAEVWCVNPPGYGGSTGTATIQSFPAMALAAFDALQVQFPDAPVLVVGNSIGTAPALYLATQRPIDAFFFRNPPPLRELIVGRYSWWNLGVGSRIVARCVPDQLDSVNSAKQANAPALFVTSLADTLVPVKYQNRIIDAYDGPKKIFPLHAANHDDPPDESEQDAYVEHLQWLKQQCLGQ